MRTLPLDYTTSIIKMFSCVRETVVQYSAQRVSIGNQTEHTIVARLGVVFEGWIISAPGMLHLFLIIRVQAQHLSRQHNYSFLRVTNTQQNPMLTRATILRVGGIVSETNFKFFIQFVAWTAILCLFALVFMAKFVAELKKEVSRYSLCLIRVQHPSTHALYFVMILLLRNLDS